MFATTLLFVFTRFVRFLNLFCRTFAFFTLMDKSDTNREVCGEMDNSSFLFSILSPKCVSSHSKCEYMYSTERTKRETPGFCF